MCFCSQVSGWRCRVWLWTSRGEVPWYVRQSSKAVGSGQGWIHKSWGSRMNMRSTDKGPQRVPREAQDTFHLYNVSEYASHWGVSMATMEDLSTMCSELPRNHQAFSLHKGLAWTNGHTSRCSQSAQAIFLEVAISSIRVSISNPQVSHINRFAQQWGGPSWLPSKKN